MLHLQSASDTQVGAPRPVRVAASTNLNFALFVWAVAGLKVEPWPMRLEVPWPPAYMSSKIPATDRPAAGQEFSLWWRRLGALNRDLRTADQVRALRANQSPQDPDASLQLDTVEQWDLRHVCREAWRPFREGFWSSRFGAARAMRGLDQRVAIALATARRQTSLLDSMERIDVLFPGTVAAWMVGPGHAIVTSGFASRTNRLEADLIRLVTDPNGIV